MRKEEKIKGGVAGGKGPAGGCWHCGGNHEMSECPDGGKAFQMSEWFPPEWSGETTELAKSVVAIERVPREGPGGASQVVKMFSAGLRCHLH